jgi:hypothetical protein
VRRGAFARRAPITLVVLVTAALGTAYATFTPAWQVPDEPAHFNYIAQLADGSPYPPVIDASDYPYDELEALKAERFASWSPAELARITYEDHQPPLYYYLASLSFGPPGAPTAQAEDGRATAEAGHARGTAQAGGSPSRAQGVATAPAGEDKSGTLSRLRSVRLLGALLGALAAALVWRCGLVAFPRRPQLAVGAAAFAGFLPMNLTVTSAANNDALAGPLAAALTLAALRRAAGRDSQDRFTVAGGLLLGLALLTKATLYPLAAMVATAALVRVDPSQGARRNAQPAQLRASLAPLAVAALIAVPWFVRYMATYGPLDPLGLTAHHMAVEAEQPTTADLVTELGPLAFAVRFVTWTFDSFWGVFGWMGVFLPTWVYGVLALSTAVAGWGLIRLAQSRGARDRPSDAARAGGNPAGSRPSRGKAPRSARERTGSMPSRALRSTRVAAVLVAAITATALAFAAYNLSFAQHQGRYWFPALPAIALLYMRGLEATRARIALRLPRGVPATPAVLATGFAAAMAVFALVSLFKYARPHLLP